MLQLWYHYNSYNTTNECTIWPRVAQTSNNICYNTCYGYRTRLHHPHRGHTCTKLSSSAGLRFSSKICPGWICLKYVGKIIFVNRAGLRNNIKWQACIHAQNWIGMIQHRSKATAMIQHSMLGSYTMDHKWNHVVFVIKLKAQNIKYTSHTCIFINRVGLLTTYLHVPTENVYSYGTQAGGRRCLMACGR